MNFGLNKYIQPHYVHNGDALLAPHVKIIFNGEEIYDLNLAGDTSYPYLYFAERIRILEAGTYYFMFYDTDEDDELFLHVESHVFGSGEEITAEPSTNFLLSTSASNIGEDEESPVTLYIYNSSGTLLHEGLETEFTELIGSWVLVEDISLSNGIYTSIWVQDGVIRHSQYLNIGFALTNKYSVVFVVANSAGSTQHANTTVLFSTTDGIPVAYTITDTVGEGKVNLLENDYIVSLKKENEVFNINNFKIKVTNNNNYQFLTDSFSPLFTIEEVDESKVCKLFTTLLDFSNKPMRFTEVLVSYIDGSSDSKLVFGHPLLFKTNANGYVEFDLLRGIKVEVAIMSMSLRRIITIPDEVEADLFDLLSDSNDPFDIIKNEIPVLTRRTL